MAKINNPKTVSKQPKTKIYFVFAIFFFVLFEGLFGTFDGRFAFSFLFFGRLEELGGCACIGLFGIFIHWLTITPVFFYLFAENFNIVKIFVVFLKEELLIGF